VAERLGDSAERERRQVGVEIFNASDLDVGDAGSRDFVRTWTPNVRRSTGNIDEDADSKRCDFGETSSVAKLR
jgi:hypothetical protein